MTIEVSMPKLGESIAEGTLVKWHKRVGERVERDEILFEISTDKVDTEIPAPEDGYLEHILVEEGETVPVHTVVCRISRSAQPIAQPTAQPAPHPTTHPGTQPASLAAGSPALPLAPGAPAAHAAERRAEGTIARATAPSIPLLAASASPPQASPQATRYHGDLASGDRGGQDGGLRERTSPLVRRLAAEHGVDLSKLKGTGLAGRVTRDDVLRHVAERDAAPVETALRASGTMPESVAAPPARAASDLAAGAERGAEEDRVEPLSVMRQQIAEHMLLSRRTSAHATTVFEVDMTAVRDLKNFLSIRFEERHGTRVTYMPFIINAVCRSLRKFPALNASLEGKNVRLHARINMGVAVALDGGLIVPVIKQADTKDLIALSRAVHDLARRARSKELTPEDVQGGTFTVTNPGVFGSVIGTPIIHQPQVAILCVGAVQKRPVVLPDTDAIAIRSMAYFSLTFDHRLLDGAVADRFLAEAKSILESASYDGAFGLK